MKDFRKLIRSSVVARRKAEAAERELATEWRRVVSHVRDAYGWTGKTLADRLGITNIYLSYIVNGHRLPGPDLIERIYRLL